MEYNIVNFIMKTNSPISTTPSKLRGYFGNEFMEYTLLHNHYGENNFLFSYPLVQYKIINDSFHVLGIGEGGEVIKKVSSSISSLKLDKEYKITEKIIQEKKVDIKSTREEKHYQFMTPWLGLNQKNYSIYHGLDNWKEKKELINKILVGNILSMSKGLGIIVNKRLFAKTKFDVKQVKYKSVYMNAFVGEFKIHYNLPDYIGIGKGVSQGFGSVKQVFD